MIAKECANDRKRLKSAKGRKRALPRIICKAGQVWNNQLGLGTRNSCVTPNPPQRKTSIKEFHGTIASRIARYASISAGPERLPQKIAVKLKNKSYFLGWVFGRKDFSRIFIFEPPDFFADFVAGFCFSSSWGKSAEKILQENPRQNLQNLDNKNPRHIAAEGPGQYFSASDQARIVFSTEDWSFSSEGFGSRLKKQSRLEYSSEIGNFKRKGHFSSKKWSAWIDQADLSISGSQRVRLAVPKGQKLPKFAKIGNIFVIHWLLFPIGDPNFGELWTAFFSAVLFLGVKFPGPLLAGNCAEKLILRVAIEMEGKS